MNIPSPAITTMNMTPQNPLQTQTTTTMTLPEESTNLVAPLKEFRTANNLDVSDHRRSTSKSSSPTYGGSLGTFMALGDLISEIFELINDTAFAGVIEGRPDQHGRNAAFLEFIGAPTKQGGGLDESIRTESVYVRKQTTKRLASKAASSIPEKIQSITVKTRKGFAPNKNQASKKELKIKQPPKPVLSLPPPSSQSSVASSRVKNYFGESPLERRRREKDVVMETIRRTEAEQANYSLSVLYSSDELEGATASGSFNSSLYTETTLEDGEEEEFSELTRRTFDTYETETIDADDERTATNNNETNIDSTVNGFHGDDAPRDDVDQVDDDVVVRSNSNRNHSHDRDQRGMETDKMEENGTVTDHDSEYQPLYPDAFPPVVQKFHSLNPLKPTTISKYNKQWPPLQFPDEAREFDTFNQELQNYYHHMSEPSPVSSSSSPSIVLAEDEYKKIVDSGKHQNTSSPQEETEEKDEAVTSSRNESTAVVPVVSEGLNKRPLPPSPERLSRSPDVKEIKLDVEEPMASVGISTSFETTTTTKPEEPVENVISSPTKPNTIVTSPSSSSSTVSSTNPKHYSYSSTSSFKSVWRPTYIDSHDRLSWSSSKSSISSLKEDTTPIPLTPDRMNQVEENKKRVQRNFQFRMKHQQAMRQKLAHRAIGRRSSTIVPTSD